SGGVAPGVPRASAGGGPRIAKSADPATGALVPLAQPVVLPFKGTFRMPFAVDTQARPVRSERGRAAYYLGNDLLTLILIQPTELSVGFPTVRLEVSFGQ